MINRRPTRGTLMAPRELWDASCSGENALKPAKGLCSQAFLGLRPTQNEPGWETTDNAEKQKVDEPEQLCFAQRAWIAIALASLSGHLGQCLRLLRSPLTRDPLARSWQ